MNKFLISLILGSTLLLAECWPQPKPTPTPVLTTNVKITDPAEGATVDLAQLVKGTSQRIPDNHLVWVVVFVHKVNRYYPQNQSADIQAGGDWASMSSIGQPRDVGLKFDLIAVLADKDGQTAFNKYLVDARDRNDYAGLERLPNGATIYDRLSVTRR
jgi:hypothetical protein